MWPGELHPQSRHAGREVLGDAAAMPQCTHASRRRRCASDWPPRPRSTPPGCEVRAPCVKRPSRAGSRARYPPPGAAEELCAGRVRLPCIQGEKARGSSATPSALVRDVPESCEAVYRWRQRWHMRIGCGGPATGEPHAAMYSTARASTCLPGHGRRGARTRPPRPHQVDQAAPGGPARTHASRGPRDPRGDSRRAAPPAGPGSCVLIRIPRIRVMTEVRPVAERRPVPRTPAEETCRWRQVRTCGRVAAGLHVLAEAMTGKRHLTVRQALGWSRTHGRPPTAREHLAVTLSEVIDDQLRSRAHSPSSERWRVKAERRRAKANPG